MKLLLFLSLFLLSPNQAFSNDLGNILSFIEDKGIEESSPSGTKEIAEQFAKKPDFKSYPQLKFIDAYKDLSNYQAKKIKEKDKEKDVKKIAKTILKNNWAEYYDEAYMNSQEYCFLNEDENAEVKKKCESLLDNFIKVNDELNKLDSEGVLNPGESEKKLLGLDLEGKPLTIKTVREADPHNDLHLESETSPGRNSILLKGHIISPDKKPEKTNLNEVICQVDQRQKLKTPKDVLAKSILILEKALVDEKTSVEDKKSIYCALYSYYEENEMMNKIFEFLFLNMPDGVMDC